MTTENDNKAADNGVPNGETKSSVRPVEGQAGTAAAAAPEANAAGSDPLAELRAERDKLKEQWLRTAADFENFRKRTKRDVDDARQRGKDEVIRDLLPVFDNLERAVQVGPGVGDASSVLEGVRMVLKLFEDTTEKLGLVRVKTLGERFDPAVHEALQQKETSEHPPGTIVAEIAPGYRFGERLVRPAMVVVARKPAEPKTSHPPENVPIQSGSDERPSEA